MTVYSIYSYHNGCLTLTDTLSSAIDYLIKNRYIVDEEVARYYYWSFYIKDLEKEANLWKALSIEQLNKVFANYFVFTEREVFSTENKN